MKLDAISIVSSDLKRSADFYTLLGFSFPAVGEGEQHVEPERRAGEPRLMIDAKELVRDMLGDEPVPPTHSMFALLCDSPAEVDTVAARVRSAGYTIIKEPWDAFWGQRYAIIADPDGYKIDLFARL